MSSFSTSRTTKNFLHNLKDGIRIRWRQDVIVSFVDKLEKLRSALTLATTLALQSSVNGNNENLEFHLRALQISSDEHNKESIRTNKKIQNLLDIMQSNSTSTVTMRQEIQNCLEEIRSLHRSTPQTQTILRWLNFRQMDWRYEEIDLAYRETFEWIFSSPGPSDAWDDFGDYLTREAVDAPYFINGKPGSGKSTLLRFIVDNEQTHEKLSIWAPQGQLLVLHFFFWHLGTPLQKSQTGMLRAILYSALSKHPELISSTLPNIYNNWKDSYLNEEPTFGEMKRAFDLFLDKASQFLKVCVIIDGIDELAGDHKELAHLARSFPRRHVKAVVSSRPINQSINVFRDCPTLRLQDLTRYDMDHYVRGNLVDHEAMRQLSRFAPHVAENLVSEIQSKAEGVFLWVRLVVRLLVDGLEAGDSISDLQRKLDSLPRDLKDLYRRMLSVILPEHQVQASEMLQIFHVWNTYTSFQPLGVILFAFAMQSSDEAFRRPVAPLDLDQYVWLYNNTEARIQSRCCGLLEVRRDRGPPNAILDWASGEDNQGSAVRYIHRTVAEFLVSGEVWEEMCKMTQQSGFNPALNLSSACLSMLKSASDITSGPTVELLRKNLTSLLGSSICFNARGVPKYMQDIEQSIATHWEYFSRLPGGAIFRNRDWLQHFRSDVEYAISKHSIEPLAVLGNKPYEVRLVSQKEPPGAPATFPGSLST